MSELSPEEFMQGAPLLSPEDVAGPRVSGPDSRVRQYSSKTHNHDTETSADVLLTIEANGDMHVVHSVGGYFEARTSENYQVHYFPSVVGIRGEEQELLRKIGEFRNLLWEWVAESDLYPLEIVAHLMPKFRQIYTDAVVPGVHVGYEDSPALAEDVVRRLLGN